MPKLNLDDFDLEEMGFTKEKLAKYPFDECFDDPVFCDENGKHLLSELLRKLYPLPNEWRVNNPVVMSDEEEFIEQFLASEV